MSVAVVFVPSPPLLLPEYVGQQDPGAELRARCVAALSSALHDDGDAGRVVVVAGHDPSADPRLEPLGVRIAHHLLSLAGWRGGVQDVVVPSTGTLDTGSLGSLQLYTAAPDHGRAAEAGPAHPGHTVLVVVGDGSARRGPTAPGHLDERSFAVDHTILAALAAPDPAPLRDLDPDLCDELLVTGRTALQAVAHLLDGANLSGEVSWSGDPYGVMYWVACWRVQ